MKGSETKNVFGSSEDAKFRFDWDNLGDLHVGRPHLGEQVPVLFYRALQYSLFDSIQERFGTDTAKQIFREAGYKVGVQFANHELNLTEDVKSFLAELSQKMLALKIGVVRVEDLNGRDGSFVITVGEDLDCSGLPVSGEKVCNFDEGLLEGLVGCYFKKKYKVREIDCWASGSKTCRFKGEVVK